MTTIWQTDEGHYEDGCGCKFELLETERRFVVFERNPKCQKPHATADKRLGGSDE